MNKSQLRKLAIRHAQGGISIDDYRQQRRELITSITSGQILIDREIPPPRPAPTPGTQDNVIPPQIAGTESGQPTKLPLHYYFAGAAGICTIILIWALWPAAEPTPKISVSITPPIQQISAARSLVESFLALRDYSQESVQTFEQNWMKVDQQERQNARNELWFKNLSRSIRDEVKTQGALAQLTDASPETATIDRLYDLANTLKISKQLPVRKSIVNATSAQPVTGADTTSTDTSTANLPSITTTQSSADNNFTPQLSTSNVTPDTATPTSESTTDSGQSVVLTTRRWLDKQPGDAVTLQIFAVNKLAKIEQLMTKHPDLDLQILAQEGATPRYRVYLGSYPDKQHAAQAFDALAQEVKTAAGKAMIKSFATIRSQLHLETTRATTQPQLTSAQPQYTLQLFASGNRGNALALIHQFSNVDLRLYEVKNSPSAYRIIYGRFASPAQALQSGERLPADLLSRIGGTPLVKSLSDLAQK